LNPPDPCARGCRARRRFGLALAAAAVLAGCSALSDETRYTGLVTGCGPATHATLVTASDRFTFTPADGVITLSGRRDANGSFAGATTLRSPKPNGSGSEPWPLKVEGRITGPSASGTYSTPRCAAHFDLREAGR
jgi:hypothetical protein